MKSKKGTTRVKARAGVPCATAAGSADGPAGGAIVASARTSGNAGKTNAATRQHHRTQLVHWLCRVRFLE